MPEKMTKEEKDKWLHIRDLEHELDYFNLYEPKEKESIHRLQDKIDDLYAELGFPKKIPNLPPKKATFLSEMVKDPKFFFPEYILVPHYYYVDENGKKQYDTDSMMENFKHQMQDLSNE